MASANRSSTGSGSPADVFDYIVVGGGTSGLVVASRLTEDPQVKVLVLEAGADRRSDPRTFVPGLAVQTYDDTDFDWSYLTVPQRGLNGRRVHQPAGKGIGGSSAINLGMMIYPSASGFDAWEKLGNPGWNWLSMMPYFRKFHTYHPPTKAISELLSLDYVDESLHGTTGPIHASFSDDPSTYTPYNQAWPQAFMSLSHATTGDPLSGTSKGAISNSGSIDPSTKQRSHAGNAYYTDKVAERPNLCVITEAIVTKIILEKRSHGSLVATGVETRLKDGRKTDFHATIEVILAAGAVKTPQLLELSGIGCPNILTAQGIEVQLNNPGVGENLQEHGFVPISYEVADGQVSADAMRDPVVAQELLSLYHDHGGAGPLGVCTLATSFMPMAEFGPSEEHKELNDLLEAHLDSSKTHYKEFPAKEKQYDLLRRILHDPDATSGQYILAPFQITPEKGHSPKDIFALSDEGQYISIVSILNHPFSRGSTHIASSDILDKPELDSGLLEHPLDLEMISRHVQWTEELVATEPLAKLLKPDGRRLPPKAAPGERMTLQEAKEIAKGRLVPHFHLCGTCAMMPKDLGGVVSKRLKVYGTKNLRIVDASVFPLIPRGNIQADVYAVAEKTADIIKEDRQEQIENEGVRELLSEWRRAPVKDLSGES